jgi:hypothetical protein
MQKEGKPSFRAMRSIEPESKDSPMCNCTRSGATHHPGMTGFGLFRPLRSSEYQQARSTLGPSPTISGWHVRATAGDIRITSAWAAKIAAAR